jgi:acetyl-CoA carboxylase carboxyl transferase subunit alpha
MMIMGPRLPQHRVRNSHELHAIYSVISPEAASSILWRDGTKAQEAATNMKITVQDLARFGTIDSILREPPGGAHRDPAAMIATTGNAIAQALNDLRNLTPDMVRQARRQKFLDIGRKLG